MLDKDKVIIVVYVGTNELSETYNLVIDLEKNIKNCFDDSVRLIFVSDVNNIGIKFECINPVLLNEEQYKKVEDKLSVLDNKIKNYIKENKNDEE